MKLRERNNRTCRDQRSSDTVVLGRRYLTRYSGLNQREEGRWLIAHELGHRALGHDLPAMMAAASTRGRAMLVWVAMAAFSVLWVANTVLTGNLVLLPMVLLFAACGYYGSRLVAQRQLAGVIHQHEIDADDYATDLVGVHGAGAVETMFCTMAEAEANEGTTIRRSRLARQLARSR